MFIHDRSNRRTAVLGRLWPARMLQELAVTLALVIMIIGGLIAR